MHQARKGPIKTSLGISKKTKCMFNGEITLCIASSKPLTTVQDGIGLEEELQENKKIVEKSLLCQQEAHWFAS